jgi:hypothetical protein
MPYSLSQAAEAVGMNRSSILRAIKAGKISATRDEHDQWQIEPAELHRVNPAAPAPASSHTDELIAELRARLEDMRAALAKAEVNAETWRAAFEREQAQRVLPTRALTRNRLCNSPSSWPSSRHGFAAPGAGCGRRGDSARNRKPFKAWRRAAYRPSTAGGHANAGNKPKPSKLCFLP